MTRSAVREKHFHSTLKTARSWESAWKTYLEQDFRHTDPYGKPRILRFAVYSSHPDYRHGKIWDPEQNVLISVQDVITKQFPQLEPHCKAFAGTGGMLAELVCFGWQHPRIQENWREFLDFMSGHYSADSLEAADLQKIIEEYCQIPESLEVLGYGQEPLDSGQKHLERQLAGSFSTAWLSRQIGSGQHEPPEPWTETIELDELSPNQAAAISDFLLRSWHQDHDTNRPLVLLQTSDQPGHWRITGLMEMDPKKAEIVNFLQSSQYPKPETPVRPSDGTIAGLGTEMLRRIRSRNEIAQGIAGGPDSRIYLKIEQSLFQDIARKNPTLVIEKVRRENIALAQDHPEPDVFWIAGMNAMSFITQRFPLYEALHKRRDVFAGRQKLEDYIAKNHSSDEIEIRREFARKGIFTLDDLLADQEKVRQAHHQANLAKHERVQDAETLRQVESGEIAADSIVAEHLAEKIQPAKILDWE